MAAKDAKPCKGPQVYREPPILARMPLDIRSFGPSVRWTCDLPELACKEWIQVFCLTQPRYREVLESNCLHMQRTKGIKGIMECSKSLKLASKVPRKRSTCSTAHCFSFTLSWAIGNKLQWLVRLGVLEQLNLGNMSWKKSNNTIQLEIARWPFSSLSRTIWQQAPLQKRRTSALCSLPKCPGEKSQNAVGTLVRIKSQPESFEWNRGCRKLKLTWTMGVSISFLSWAISETQCSWKRTSTNLGSPIAYHTFAQRKSCTVARYDITFNGGIAIWEGSIADSSSCLCHFWKAMWPCPSLTRLVNWCYRVQGTLQGPGGKMSPFQCEEQSPPRLPRSLLSDERKWRIFSTCLLGKWCSSPETTTPDISGRCF